MDFETLLDSSFDPFLSLPFPFPFSVSWIGIFVSGLEASWARSMAASFSVLIFSALSLYNRNIKTIEQVHNQHTHRDTLLHSFLFHSLYGSQPHSEWCVV